MEIILILVGAVIGIAVQYFVIKLGEPEQKPEEEQSPTIEEYQPTQLYPPTGNRTRTMAAATAAGLGVIAVAFVLIRRTTQRDK